MDARRLQHLNDQLGTAVQFDAEAVQVLMHYGFPGNVRELLNIIERSIALANDTTIRRTDLPPHIAGTLQRKTPLLTLQDITAEAEKNHIAQILRLTHGNRSKAAEILGVSRKTLWEKINSYQLDL